MKKSKVIEMYQAMKGALLVSGPSVKFKYNIAKNKGKIESENKEITEALINKEKYERERAALARELGDKDEAGKAVVENGVFKGALLHPDWEKRFDELKLKYKKELDQAKELLDEEIEEPEWRMIPFSQFTDDVPGLIVDSLMPLILNDDLTEVKKECTDTAK